MIFLRIGILVALLERDSMDDAEMVDYLRRCALAPDQPRPSIETLLHVRDPQRVDDRQPGRITEGGVHPSPGLHHDNFSVY